MWTSAVTEHLENTFERDAERYGTRRKKELLRAVGVRGCEYEVDVDLEKRLVDQRCYRTPGEYI